MFSSKSNEWETPPDFYNKLNKKFKFTLDPCCTHLNNKCEKYYTIEEDGLSQSWANETVFVNPPYGDVGKWVKGAIDGKVDNCKKRMTAEWIPKLMADDSVDSIPADEDDLIALIVARDDYKNRVDRDKE